MTTSATEPNPNTAATLEPIGHLTFAPVGETPITADGTFDDCMKMAKNDFILTRLSIPLLNMSDGDLEKIIRDADDFDAFMEHVDVLADAKERHEAGAEFFGSAFARLMVVLSRVYGEAREATDVDANASNGGIVA